ncbi:MAG: hypothetical protein LAT76_12620 [Schleiferiaceae bacterium]|nr:hypothetical protein [Schleiferiaceae bacterium]
MQNKLLQNQRTHILVNGFFWSGSSAIVDFLSDYTCIGRVPHEFNDFRRLGWVGDVLASDPNADLSKGLREFIQANKPNSPNQMAVVKQKTWQLLFPKKGNSGAVVKKRYMALFDLIEQLDSTHISNDQKLALANEWVSQVAHLYAPKNNFVVFDQPLRMGQHTGVWEAVFNPYNLILVYRDPRDQFADIIQREKLFDDFASAEDIAELYGRTRQGAINYHVTLLKKKLQYAKDYASQHSETLFFSFESFLKKHDQLSVRLLDKLGISNTLKVPTPRFQTAMSLKNVGIYKNVLTATDLHQLEEVMDFYTALEQHNSFYN